MSTVEFKDYYKVLGVERTADPKAIQAAFRKRAREVHPDVNRDNQGAEEAFKDVNEAYEVLSDPEKRKMYDRFGQDWSRYRDAGVSADQANGPSYSSQDFGEWFAGSGETTFTSTDSTGRFSDFFNMLFGSQSGPGPSIRRQPRAVRGEDHELLTTVTVEEAFHGAVRNVSLQVPQYCPTCNGTGEVRGATCPTCDGTGQVRQKRTIEVKVPAGVKTGSRIRVAGQGGAGSNGGPYGDVYLVIKVIAHPVFERSGNDFTMTLKVPLLTVILGGEVVVPTMSGRVALTIPETTQSGRTFRLRGKGMPILGQPGTFGDLRVKVEPELPQQLTVDERRLYESLRDVQS